MNTIFFLSPARCDGLRAAQLARSASPMGVQLRGDGAPLGDVFAWLSALYFRGKLAYARAFARPPEAPEELPGTYVMAAGFGLRAPETTISSADLKRMGTIDIASDGFAKMLRRDASDVDAQYGADTQVVLLGSIATGKYVDALLAVFGERLVFPSAFVGRGDMSRGGLLLRAARDGEELLYAPIRGATLHGKRPPKLPRWQPAEVAVSPTRSR